MLDTYAYLAQQLARITTPPPPTYTAERPRATYPRPGALRGRKLTAPKHPLVEARELKWAEAELQKRLSE